METRYRIDHPTDTYNGKNNLFVTVVKKKEVLHVWYQQDGCAEPTSCGLQPTASHISHLRFGIKCTSSSKIDN
jgi:hypothetical protein